MNNSCDSLYKKANERCCMSKESEVKLDLKISWKMLKANYRAFLMTELFVFISFILALLLAVGIFAIVIVSVPSLTFNGVLEDMRNKEDIRYSIIGTVFFGITHTLVVSFLNCQYGLAYDVMSSGDMFSEFKRAFKYFQRFWWQYMIFSLISVVSIFIPRRREYFASEEITSSIYFDIGIIVVQLMIYFIFTVISSGTLPSVTAQGSFKNSFVETFRILRKQPARILKTWGAYFFIFIFPIVALSFVRMELHYFLGPNRLFLIFDIVAFLLYLIYLFIGYPLKTLISTRIYNSVDFERFKPLTESHDDLDHNQLKNNEEEKTREE